MSHNFLFNTIFHKLLKAMDCDLSQEERTKGCPIVEGIYIRLIMLDDHHHSCEKYPSGG